MEKIKKQQPDFTSGKVLKNLVLFAIPMLITTFLQMLFNAADVAVVGQFAGSEYQAAVGATSSTTHLIVNLFIGISVGANVVMATAYGAKDEEKQQRVVHSAMAVSVVSGVIVLLIGVFGSRLILELINTPENIIEYSTMYMQVYFLGAPAMMVYNFGAALMRGVGDTKKPLKYLFVSGILNVIINIVSVVFFHLHVIGVALGTTVSQYVAAVWIVLDLRRAEGGLHYSVRKTRFHGKETGKIVSIGIPMGISSCLFSFSNLFLQSSINGFGDMAIAGSTVASNIESLLCDSVTSSVENAVVTIVGQNVGAKKEERVHRVIGAGFVAILVSQAVVALVLGFFGRSVARLFNPDPTVVEWTMIKVHYVAMTWGIVSIMNCYGGALRGMGYSMVPMLINLMFTCLVRILYILLIYPTFATQTIEQIYILYPITWILSGLGQMIMFYVVAHRNGYFRKKPRSPEKEA